MWIHSVRCRLPPIYILYLELIRTPPQKTDADTVYGNTSLTVTCKACVPHYNIRLQLTTDTMSRVNCMTHKIAVGKLLMIRVKYKMASTN